MWRFLKKFHFYLGLAALINKTWQTLAWYVIQPKNALELSTNKYCEPKPPTTWSSGVTANVVRDLNIQTQYMGFVHTLGNKSRKISKNYT